MQLLRIAWPAPEHRLIPPLPEEIYAFTLQCHPSGMKITPHMTRKLCFLMLRMRMLNDLAGISVTSIHGYGDRCQ